MLQQNKVKGIYSPSTFQGCGVALLTVATVLYVGSPELPHLRTKAVPFDWNLPISSTPVSHQSDLCFCFFFFFKIPHVSEITQ